MNIIRGTEIELDLVDIYDSIHADHPAAAETLLAEFEATVWKLADQPGMGRLLSLDAPQLRDVRCWPMTRFSNYLIFYRSTPGRLELLRVLHGARDWLGLLSD